MSMRKLPLEEYLWSMAYKPALCSCAFRNSLKSCITQIAQLRILIDGEELELQAENRIEYNCIMIDAIIYKNWTTYLLLSRLSILRCRRVDRIVLHHVLQ